MQIQKVAKGLNLPKTNRTGYVRPLSGVELCRHCNASGQCMIEQMEINQDSSYQLLKKRRTYFRGEHIFRRDDSAKALYFIGKGSVKSYMIMEDGEEQVLNFYLAGDVFGLDSIGVDSYASSIIALETTSVCRVALLDLQNQNLGKPFFNMVSDSLIREHNLMLMLARKGADGRIASFLVSISRHFDKLKMSSDIFELTMTRQDIALYLGLAIETVSRTLRRFQDSGVIAVNRRKIQIYDFDSLLSIAGTQITR